MLLPAGSPPAVPRRRQTEPSRCRKALALYPFATRVNGWPTISSRDGECTHASPNTTDNGVATEAAAGRRGWSLTRLALRHDNRRDGEHRDRQDRSHPTP